MTAEVKQKIQRNYENLVNLREKNIFKQHLGSYSLVSHSDRINEIIDIVPSSLGRFDEISQDVADKLLLLLGRLYNHLDSIESIDDKQFMAQENVINNELKLIYESYYNIKPYLQTYVSAESLKVWLEEAKLERDKIKNEATEFVNAVEKMRPEKEAIVQSKIFKSAADINHHHSKMWLVGIVGSVVILLVVIYNLSSNFCFGSGCFTTTTLISYNTICEDCGRTVLYTEIAKAIAYKILIISIFILIVKFCIKNYNNCKHNETINRHKQNSFEAALSFIQHTESGKDEIFKLAAQAVFSQQKTGYITKEGEVLTPSIIDKITSKL